MKENETWLLGLVWKFEFFKLSFSCIFQQKNVYDIKWYIQFPIKLDMKFCFKVYIKVSFLRYSKMSSLQGIRW